MTGETKTIRYHRTLFYYDGIQIFEARDAEGGHYVAVMTVDDRYLVARVASGRLRLFLSADLDLRALLIESDPEDRYVTTADTRIDQPLALEKLAVPFDDSALLPGPGFLLPEQSLDIGRQIDDLKLLEDGWLNGEGRAPSKAGLDWLLGIFGSRYPADAPQPYLYPTVAGGVQAEWPLGSREAELDVNLDTHSALWHVLDLKSDEVQERTLDCDSDDDWTWLLRQLGSVD